MPDAVRLDGVLDTGVVTLVNGFENGTEALVDGLETGALTLAGFEYVCTLPLGGFEAGAGDTLDFAPWMVPSISASGGISLRDD